MLVDRHGAVVLATMNRPDTRNSISESDMVEALEAVVTEVNRDRAVGALVLTGAGDGFSSGGNLKDMRDRTRMFAGSPSEVRDGYRHGIQRIPRALYDCEVPRAREMAFTGMVVDAETALAWGLVSRVAAAPELLESAWSWRAASRPAREAVMAILERRSASFTGR